MFDLSKQELAVIDESLEPKLAWAKDRTAETEQLALDATRLLSCTSDRLEQYESRGFFKRCWYKLSGKTGELQRANVKDLIEMQKVAWRYINLLSERDLMLAHSIVTVKNNLLTLRVEQKEIRNEIVRMANRINDRFIRLEDRVANAEAATNINGWRLALADRDYDEKYTPYFRLLSVVRDFYQIKESNWNMRELSLLRTGIKEVGLEWKKPVSIAQFVEGLVEEIEQADINKFEDLVLIPNNGSCIPSSFILENIAVPSYLSLFELNDKYLNVFHTIESIKGHINTTKEDAIRKAILSFVKNQGVNLEIQIPLRDIAVELLHCMSLTKQLFVKDIIQDEKQDESNTSTVSTEISNSVDLEYERKRFNKIAAELVEIQSNKWGEQIVIPVIMILEDYIKMESDEDEDIGDYLERFVNGLNAEMILEAENSVLKDVYKELEEYAEGLKHLFDKDVFFVNELERIWPIVVKDDGDWESSLDELHNAGIFLLDNKPEGLLSSVIKHGAAGAAVGVAASSILPIAIPALLVGSYFWENKKDEALSRALEKWNKAAEVFMNKTELWEKKACQNMNTLFSSWFQRVADNLQHIGDADKHREVIDKFENTFKECDRKNNSISLDDDLSHKLSDRFEQASIDVTELSEAPDNIAKLKLYALYKQASTGNCTGTRPGMMDFVGRAKYDEWKKYDGTSMDEAKQMYIDFVKELKRADKRNK